MTSINYKKILSWKICIKQFLTGVYDSLYIFARLFGKNDSSVENDFKESNSERKLKVYVNQMQLNLKILCFLNGTIFFSSVCYMDYIILPLLDWIFYKVLWDEYYDTITFMVRVAFKLIILYFWTMSILFFYSLFQLFKFAKQDETKRNIFTFVYRFLKNIFFKSIDIVTVFSYEIILLIESLLMCLIPLTWLSSVLFHIHFSFFISFMIFDLKWSLMSWDIQQKMDFIESRCMYFLGFGLVLSLLFTLPGSLIYSTTLSTFFIPIVILNGIETKCENLDSLSIRFPVFDFQISLLNFLTKLTSSGKKKNNIEKLVQF